MQRNFSNNPARNINIRGLTRSQNRAIAWLCIFLLFAQTLIPLQSHTKLVKNHHGILVSVCTLEGIKQVELDLPPIAGEEKTSQQELPSAAEKFSTLLAESDVSVHDISTNTLLLKVSPARHPLVSSFETIQYGWYPIRAPPLV